MSDVEKFYDEFADKQEDAGINRRHVSIDNWLTEFGLKTNHQVLEIGCGVGTQTELLAKRLNEGSITACDISSERVKRAESRLNGFSNAKFIACDIVEYNMEGSYDFIIMPDVLEHIPIDQHRRLFVKLSQLLKEEGSLVIHIPDPYYNQWVSIHRPELQQIIDQNLFMPLIIKPIYDAGLCIEYLKTYDLHANNGDYQVILIRKVRDKLYDPLIRSKSPIAKLIWKLKSFFHIT